MKPKDNKVRSLNDEKERLLEQLGELDPFEDKEQYSVLLMRLRTIADMCDKEMECKRQNSWTLKAIDILIKIVDLGLKGIGAIIVPLLIAQMGFDYESEGKIQHIITSGWFEKLTRSFIFKNKKGE